jgi:hypothetical protein
MATVLLEKFFKQPKEKLDTIHELLDSMKTAGWDVELQMQSLITCVNI